LTSASFLAPAAPSRDLMEALEQAALTACPARGVSLSRGRIFSSDSIVAQFHHLDEISERHGCIGIEMETAAVFRAAALVGVPAAALLQISDLPRLGRSLFSGRTEEDRRRRRRLRSELLPRIALDVLTAPRGRVGAPEPGSSGEEQNA
jgi:purine-nucleoside phosphorylase